MYVYIYYTRAIDKSVRKNWENFYFMSRLHKMLTVCYVYM